MTDGTNEKAPSRRRGKPIEVWVTDEEKAAITERAEEAGMSRCSGQLIPDTVLSFSSAFAGASPLLN